jgi:hypothetical protein
MFIVDFGVFEPGLNLAEPGPGKVWILSPTSNDPNDPVHHHDGALLA